MFGKISASVPAAIMISILCLSGCSDNNGETAPDFGAGTVTLQPGDTLDVTYHGALNVRDWTNLTVEILLIKAFTLVDDRIKAEPDIQNSAGQIPKIAGSTALYYDSITGYWHYEKLSNPGLYEHTHVDSVQFLHGDSIVQWPDSALLSAVNLGVSWLWTIDDEDGQDTLVASGLVVILESVPGLIAASGDVIFSGSGYCYGQSLESTSGIDESCQFKADMSLVLSDWTLTIRNVFGSAVWPYTGTIEMTGPIYLGCEGDSAFIHADNWLLNTTYSNGLQSVAVENSEYFW